MRTERMKKKEQERNDLAEGPRSRMERNDLKKVGMCSALPTRSTIFSNKSRPTQLRILKSS